MQKKTLLALLLALVMILSGCSLVTVDTAKDNARVIVDVDGDTVNKLAIKNLVSNQLYQNEYMNQLYSAYGLSGSYSTDEATVTSEVIDALVMELVERHKAQALGFTEMTDEEKETIQQTAQSNYDSFVSSVASNYLGGSKLEGEELTKAAEAYIAENDVKNLYGYSKLEDFVQDETFVQTVKKLEEDAVKDVAVTEEEIKADYDAKVEADKAAMEENPDTYGSNLSYGSTSYYVPAGYRMIKHILIPLQDEDSTAISEKTTALTTAQTALSNAQADLEAAAEDADKTALQTAVDEAQAAVDAAQAALDEAKAAAYANIKEKADEVYAKATAADADFDALITEYSSDSMPAEGYAVREGYAYYVAPFVTAAMALSAPGQVSEPVATDHGYHIIQYVSDVQEGAVDLETVRAGIESALLSTKKNETLSAAKDQWLQEAKVTTYLDRLN